MVISAGRVRRRCLSLLPDTPRWVETRDLLSQKDAVVLENPAQSGFVVWSEESGIGSVVGDPEPLALARAAESVSELLAFADNRERVRALLPSFSAEPAAVFSAPERLPPAPPHRCREISRSELASLKHLPAELSSELSGVARNGAAVVAAFDGASPVAFAYAAAESESLWDMSIDTIPSHRRKGYAAAAALYLMRVMTEKGKSAVWGALESNRASANLARRLGFVENDKLWVLTRRAEGVGDSTE